jgi:hypothetical protein
MTFNSKDTLELLNYEGPVLRLQRKSEDSFDLLNQWGESMMILTRAQVLSFVMGDISIHCERQHKEWRFQEQSSEARVSGRDLDRFLFGTPRTVHSLDK